jgi:hypothetical protein
LLLLYRTKPKYGDVVKVERGSVSGVSGIVVVQQQQQTDVQSRQGLGHVMRRVTIRLHAALLTS